MMHAREAFTLRAYNSLQLNRSGHLELSSITGEPTRTPWPPHSSLLHPQLERSAGGSSPLLTPTTLAASLKRLGLPATEENAASMLRYLGRAEDGYISYGQFRNFLLLLPPEQARAVLTRRSLRVFASRKRLRLYHRALLPWQASPHLVARCETPL